MSYTRCFYHIIFRTKYSECTIPIGPDEELYKYITGIIKNKNCVPYRINGMPDHVHIGASLSSAISLADFVKDVKTASSIWLKENRSLFPFFRGWASEYAGLSYGSDDIQNIVEYIKGQKEHHRHLSFRDELKNWLIKEKVEINELYFLKD